MTPVTVHDIIRAIETIAPFSLAADWDNVGLMAGDERLEATGVIVALDPTPDLPARARKHGANVVITHHPAIFSPLRQLHTGHPTGAFVAEAVRHNCAVIACHTNLDVVAAGVSAVLAERLGITAATPLATGATGGDPATGFGMIGDLASSMDAAAFAAHVCRVLELDGVPATRNRPARVRRVAVCGGSGSDLCETALAAGADTYVSGEIKHSTARWAEAAGLWVIDAGHFATEHPAMEVFAAQLSRALTADGIHLPVTPEPQINPFSLFLPGEE